MVVDNILSLLILFGKFEQSGSKNECENKKLISKCSSSAHHIIYDYPMEPP